MSATLIKNARIFNEGVETQGDLLIKGERIERVAPNIQVEYAVKEIDANGKYLFPGVIDDQVHFRQPGLTHKADIYTESRAAVAGGTTSFMEMPNTIPATLTQELLQKKYDMAAKDSLANYSFYMGGSNDNYDEAMKTDLSRVCGLKLFMGSSTGNMLVDRESTLRKFFSNFPGLIATHCEDEETIAANLAKAKEMFGENIPYHYHPIIRDEDACYRSSSKAFKMAKDHGTRLHILHLTTKKEMQLFDPTIPKWDRHITAEVCVHHLWFDAADYYIHGSKIKCNPAIKNRNHRRALIEGMLEGRIDIIATDHAPHTLEEKERLYLDAPSGLPLVQHGLQMMLEFHLERVIPLATIIEKMCHAPAILYGVKERGFLREGYFADIAMVDMEKRHTIYRNNLHYKCGWSPLEGTTVKSSIAGTFVNGKLVYDGEEFYEGQSGQRMLFEG